MRRYLRYTRLPALVLLVLVVVVPGSALAQGENSPEGDGPDRKGERPTIKPRPEGEVVSDQVIVKFKEEAGVATRSEARRGAGLEKKKDLGLIDAEVDRVRGKSVEQAVRDLESRPDVEYAEPDFKVYPTGYADEPRFGDLWGLDNTGQAVNGAPEDGTADVDVDAREASSETQGDPNLVIAVIDNGVDFSHPDLKDRAWTNPGETPDDGVDNDGNGKVDDVNGWDFYHKDETVHDDGEDYHGTHVAGTIAASANGEGVVGVAPNVKIMALKFLGPDGGAISDAILAIQYAKSKGAKISNNSWGGGPYSRALKDAIDASGQLFVATAGNGGFDGFGDDNDVAPHYPASYTSSNVLSVAAVDNRGNLGNFSNYGAKSVDISAPGVDVLSSVPGVSGRPGAALSSVGSSGGEAFTAGFGAEEIGTEDGQSSFLQKALEAVGQSSSEPVVLVDDDRSHTLGYPDVGPTLSAAIESATGSAPETTINVPDGNGPNLDQLQGKTVVWATGRAFSSGSGATTLTDADQSTLTNFLNGGGKLLLTGKDALYNIENSTFVTSTLKLDSQGELPPVLSTVAFEGAAGTALAGESYDLNSSLAIPKYHDVLVPAGTAAETQGNLKAPHSWSFLKGTSMAAPHATGVAALAASESPGLLSSPATLKQVLMDSGKPVPATQGKTVTGKMVDANAALAPRVTAVSPKSGARNVSRGANVTATFSEEMDETSVEAMDPSTLKPSTFTLVRSGSSTPVKATVTYDAATKKATLNPSNRLRAGTVYVATVKGGTNGAKNADGEPMASDKTWKFRTKK